MAAESKGPRLAGPHDGNAMEASSHDTPTIDLDEIRERLQQPTGKQFWRSLDELAGTERFQDFLKSEFPQVAQTLFDAVDRRQFLKLTSASLALAGLSACTRQPEELIVPYVRQPENVVPGEPLYFATAMPRGADALGLLVENHMGRPTKIEGNPSHPASLGATDSYAQAAVLDLYDPDRARAVTRAGEIRPWSALAAEVAALVERLAPKQGEGLRFLSGATSSPTVAAQMAAIREALPKARWHRYEPVHRDAARTGSEYAFGGIVDSRYRFDKADVILSLDADFLSVGPGSVRHTRDFTRRRKVEKGGAPMNRLYVVESIPSLTGAAADHRVPLGPAPIESVAFAVARGLGLDAPAPEGIEALQGWVDKLVADLKAHEGTSLVVPGEYQSPVVHAFAHRINHALGNVGATVLYTRTAEADPQVHGDSLRELVADMEAGKVEALFVLGGNPVYDAPADLQFAKHFEKVGLRAHLAAHDDETSQLCHWQIPEAHFLESWSDVRAFDGTASIIQPLIAPLYEGKTVHEVLGLFQDDPMRSGYERVRDHWKRETGSDGDAFEKMWRRWLHDGVIPESEFGPQKVALRANWRAHHSEMGRTPTATRPADRAAAPVPAAGQMGATAAGGDVEVLFRPDPAAYDGRYANNGWLQELPRPMTLLTWDNAALMSPALASRLGLANEQVVTLTAGKHSVDAPVWILPGQADGVITVHLGYGRRRGGEIANGCGFDAYALRTASALWSGTRVEVAATGAMHRIACTQDHHSMEGRNLVRQATLAKYEKHPHFVHEGEHHVEMSMYPDYEYTGYAWGMTIDLNACIGCNACAIACQAENNIPIVGKEEVSVGREMHWIRIDRYFEGDLDNPSIHHQPLACVQCENAPCEPVCPANATVHSDEGLNDMVYNRCVGTRYCSNNCPYKVRRFNFRLYADWNTEQTKLQRNPDFTVRSRGVMEKCTYCVQRINYARIEAKREGRKIADGDIRTACQQVCAAEAITFGDINDDTSQVAMAKKDPRNYTILDAVNTRPRTSYLASLKNPNPEIGDA